MTAAENRQRKAWAIAPALYRRGLTVGDLAALPYTSTDRTTLTVSRFVRDAYREAGIDANVPSGPGSQTWHLTAGLLAWMDAHPDHERVPDRDLLDDRPRWVPAEEEPEAVMLTVAGKRFRCPCGANVFTRCGQVFTCNACGEQYTDAPEEEDPWPSPEPSSHVTLADTTWTTTTTGDAATSGSAPSNASSPPAGTALPRHSAPAGGDWPRHEGCACAGCGAWHHRYGPTGGGALCPPCRRVALGAA